ncbi:hypothetical protein KUTeg_004851 [Tegillarca granosa]|uniref:Uncharacterized protein n=1 Tax=Tegillarca granosa TaxID=220873 RepID=A0ABQ9FLX1_TEGGR|nr:hypothetical protein KUTeg_004851 [Tegillarca granosa]
MATSTGSIYSNCSRFPLTTNLKNSAVQVLATQGNSATTVSASRLNKPLFSPSLVQKNSDTVAATCVSSPSLNQFSAPFVTETHSNLVSGSKELTSDISSQCHTTLTFAVPANQSQVSESTNQNLNFLAANSLKVSVPERKSTNQQTFQNNVVSGDQPMKNQLMIPVSVPTCQSSVSANQVPLSTNYVQLPLTVNQVSELISANKIKVPVSSNQLTVSLPINQSTVSVSTNQITVPLPINQAMFPVSANQKTAAVPANQITVPVSTNQIVVPLSASNQTLPISTQLLVANKPTVLVSTNKNSNVALSTTCTNGTSPIVSASHVKVPVSVNELSVPVLTNKSKPPVSRTQLKTPVSSELACLTTPLLVNQLTTPGSTNPLKLNCNALSLNQKRIPVSNQLSIPVSSQFVIPVTPNISAVESTNLTSKTTLRSSPQYKPSEGTLISSNQNRISGSSAGVQTACNTTSSSAIPTSIVIHSVNDCVIDPVTSSKKSTVSSSLLHCSQVQPSLTSLSDRLVQMDTQIINQSNQTKARKRHYKQHIDIYHGQSK